MSLNPYAQYKEQSLTTLSKNELLIKVLDELVKQLTASISNMNKKEHTIAHKNLMKSQDIILTLKYSIDHKYKVLDSLSDLYMFFYTELIKANVAKDPKIIEEILPLIIDLRDAFKVAERTVRLQQK
ncbi:MAG: flagellar export chaperone FliS [Oscillospiraceae bacterium]